MDEFRDPSSLGKAAQIVVTIWLAVAVLYGGAAIYSIVAINAYQASDAPAWMNLETVDRVSMITGGLYLATYLACWIVVGRWIYRVNKNAWQVSNGMTVSPGWNIGSFFIPILNLFQPFRGVRESWQASHSPADPELESTPGLMRLWWGAWLIAGMLGNLSFRLGMRAETLDDFRTVAQIDVAGMVFDLIAGVTLLWIIRHLTAVQAHLRDYEVFA
jgi:hypothetical protein